MTIDESLKPTYDQDDLDAITRKAQGDSALSDVARALVLESIEKLKAVAELLSETEISDDFNPETEISG